MDDLLGLQSENRSKSDNYDELEVVKDPLENAIERMWPLDLALAVLGGLTIYTIATRIPADDGRWYYSPWLYAAAVPLGVVASSLILRNIASRFVRRSLQFGFLLSVMVHLLLTIAAFNFVIFAPIWSNSTSGVKQVRAPIRKTVPDYLFTRDDIPEKQPDWSRPVDATTTSRTVAATETQLPPIEVSAERLEMPSEQPRPEEQPERTFLTPRNVPETAPPTPSSSAGKLARQPLLREPSVDSAVPAPNLSPAETSEAQAIERATDNRSLAQLRQNEVRIPSPTAMQLPDMAVSSTAPTPRLERRLEAGLPRLGSPTINPENRSILRPSRDASPAGAVPSTPTISIARQSDAAERMMSDRATPISEARRATGAELRPTPSEIVSSIVPDSSDLLDAPRERRNLAVSGLPTISPGTMTSAAEQTGRSARMLSLPDGALAGPDISRLATELGSSSAENGNDAGPASAALDRSRDVPYSASNSGSRSESQRGASLQSDESAMAAMLDLSAPTGPAGLSADPSRRIGFALAEELPEIASIDFGSNDAKRRDLGGPPPPAGSQITGVRPFDRRKLRTAGGAALTPEGVLGPETEEAIERGLAYLAERQNADGSWSLQGHGDPTRMRSDTAATGLCILAFQGAGYTHREHQYAKTVAKGIQFLLDNQRSSGDLYRPEDALSNRNAWLYSHGIAALALCEAWGMTRDPVLKDPAQRSIDFIVSSQNRKDGGWRYEPGIDSDTSVTGWMVMAMKSAELSSLNVPKKTLSNVERWLDKAQASSDEASLYRYNPDAPDTATQRHGREVTPTMTAVGLLARLYMGWERTKLEMREGADYLAKHPPAVGSPREPKRDTYYWYYATQVMFHMGGDHWKDWNGRLNPILTSSQVLVGEHAGSWEPNLPVPDRWAPYAGRIYVTAMNLLSLEVYYRHLPIYDETAK